ncbi:MAG: hypothetical protein ACJA2B_000248, partial [Candidatus Endobugula sp.]
MAKYMLAWEMGGGLGHTVSLYEIACHLIDNGHQVVVVLQDLRCSDLFAKKGILTSLAPRGLFCKPYYSSPNSMAEILWCKGYGDESKFLSLINDWSRLIKQYNPDFLIGDYSPSALLSAKINRVNSIAIGSAFSFPPVSNVRPFRYIHAAEALRLKRIEHRVLTVMNGLLEKSDLPRLSVSNEVFYGDKNFVWGLPELDYYAGKRSISYVMPIFHNGDYILPCWQGRRRKILVYIKSEYEELDNLFKQMAECPQADFIVYLAGDGLGHIELKDNIQIYTAPINIDKLLDSADLVICHSGSGL